MGKEETKIRFMTPNVYTLPPRIPFSSLELQKGEPLRYAVYADTVEHARPEYLTVKSTITPLVPNLFGTSHVTACAFEKIKIELLVDNYSARGENHHRVPAISMSTSILKHEYMPALLCSTILVPQKNPKTNQGSAPAAARLDSTEGSTLPVLSGPAEPVLFLRPKWLPPSYSRFPFLPSPSCLWGKDTGFPCSLGGIFVGRASTYYYIEHTCQLAPPLADIGILPASVGLLLPPGVAISLAPGTPVGVRSCLL